MHPEKDETIMAQVAKGKVAQLSPLYRRYRDQLYGFFLNRCREAPLAEDLLQNTFERVLRYRASYRPEQRFRTWLYAVAHNVYRDHCRTAGRMPIDGLDDCHDLALDQPTAQDRMIQFDTEQGALAALASLSPAYRELLNLAWKREMKYAEIATVLGTSENNVKVKMHRARRQLSLNYQKMNRS